jgi:hypothetical protein
MGWLQEPGAVRRCPAFSWLPVFLPPNHVPERPLPSLQLFTNIMGHRGRFIGQKPVKNGLAIVK